MVSAVRETKRNGPVPTGCRFIASGVEPDGTMPRYDVRFGSSAPNGSESTKSTVAASIATTRCRKAKAPRFELATVPSSRVSKVHDDILGPEGRTVVEEDAGTQVKAPARPEVERLPRLREIGKEVAVLVLGHQPVEDELEDAARSLVGGDPRIEMDRRALERDGERVVRRRAGGRCRAAGRDEKRQREEAGPQYHSSSEMPSPIRVELWL